MLVTALGLAADASKEAPKKEKAKTEKNANQGATIPIPIGHEAKGVTLPDYDLEGRLRGRFVAGSAKRIDETHVQLHHLKMMTYTAAEKPDLEIETIDSVLDLKTRVLSSQQRTTVKRTDFQITGNTMEFNTSTREGTLVGDVRMVINGRSHFERAESE